MVQAHTPQPAEYFAETARARAMFADAAQSTTIATVLGALIDFMSTMRQRHAESTGTSNVLTRLAGNGPMRSADLALSLHLDQSTVSRHVASLESEGMVERVPVADDRRAHLVQLTERGSAAAHDLVAQKVAALEGVLSSWPREDLQSFAQLLERFSLGLVNERHSNS